MLCPNSPHAVIVPQPDHGQFSPLLSVAGLLGFDNRAVS